MEIAKGTQGPFKGIHRDYKGLSRGNLGGIQGFMFRVQGFGRLSQSSSMKWRFNWTTYGSCGDAGLR